MYNKCSICPCSSKFRRHVLYGMFIRKGSKVMRFIPEEKVLKFAPEAGILKSAPKAKVLKFDPEVEVLRFVPEVGYESFLIHL